jgi:hypothetical protein
MHGRPRVAVFFRHPGLVALGDRSFVIDGPAKGVKLEFFAFTQRLEHHEDGTVSARPVAGEDASDQAVFTQFVVLVPIIGVRDRHHERWASAIDWNPAAAGVLVPSEESYRRDGLAVTFESYAEDIAGRVRVEVRNSLPYFLACYSIAALAALPTATNLYNYLVIVPPGRIARGADYRSLLGQALARPTRAALLPVDPVRMESALRRRGVSVRS